MLEFPSYSLIERDRRFDIARQLIADQDLDGLVVFSQGHRQNVEGYFSNEFFGGTVIFPPHGDPRLLTLYAGRIAARRELRRQSTDVWIPDAVMGITPPAVAEALSDLGLNKGKLGAINGPTGQPYGVWRQHLAANPDIEWIDVSSEFNQAIVVKSEEELDAFRWCAHIGEEAVAALLEVAKLGAADSELVGAFIGTVYRLRGTMLIPTLELGIGPETVHFSSPVWWASGGAPYVLRPGDVIQAEGMISYAGLETQPQVTVALDPVPEVYDELAPLARKAYELAVENLRAGRRFGDVVAAVEEPLEAADGWYAGNALHLLNPNVAHSRFEINVERSDWLGPIYGGRPLPTPTPEMNALVLQPAMTAVVEPSPGKGHNRVHIGGNVIIRTDGPAEELNSVGTRFVTV